MLRLGKRRGIEPHLGAWTGDPPVSRQVGAHVRKVGVVQQGGVARYRRERQAGREHMYSAHTPATRYGLSNRKPLHLPTTIPAKWQIPVVLKCDRLGAI